MLKFFLIEIILFIIWVIALIGDSLLYEEWKNSQIAKKKREAELKKKNEIKFKWDEKLPRTDLFL